MTPVYRLLDRPHLSFLPPPCSIELQWWPASRIRPVAGGASVGWPCSALSSGGPATQMWIDGRGMALLTFAPLAFRILAAAASSILPLVMADGKRDRVDEDMNWAISGERSRTLLLRTDPCTRWYWGQQQRHEVETTNTNDKGEQDSGALLRKNENNGVSGLHSRRTRNSHARYIYTRRGDCDVRFPHRTTTLAKLPYQGWP